MANCSVMSQAIYGALRIVIVRQNPSKESKKNCQYKVERRGQVTFRKFTNSLFELEFKL